MTGIKVTPEQLHQMGGSVANGAGEIDATLGRLHGQVAPLVGADWMGAASQQFDALYQQWNDAARRLQQSLAGISRLLHHAGTSYGDAERAITASFRHT